MFLVWNDGIIGKTCITPLKDEDLKDIDGLIEFLRKEMAECSKFRVTDKPMKTYRGQEVHFIPRLELIDAYYSGKSIAQFYRDFF